MAINGKGSVAATWKGVERGLWQPMERGLWQPPGKGSVATNGKGSVTVTWKGVCGSHLEGGLLHPSEVATEIIIFFINVPIGYIFPFDRLIMAARRLRKEK